MTAIKTKIFYNVSYLIDSSDKLKILILSFFTFIGLLLELVGLATIIPIIKLTIDNNSINKEFIDIEFISSFFGFQNTLIFLLIFLLIVFFIKMLFFVLLVYKQKNFVSNLVKKISDKLFNRYLNQEFSYFSNKNRSSIIQNLQSETYYLFLFFESTTTIISEFLLVLSMLLFILFLEPQGFILMFLYFTSSTLIYLFLTKKKSTQWGQKRLYLDQSMAKLILETFGSIKEILIYNTQRYFSNNYKSINSRKTKYISYRLTIDQFPKLYYEFITIIFIVIYTYYLSIETNGVGSIIVKLGIIIAIAYKVIPSLSKISSSYQTIKNYSSSLKKIVDELISSKEEDTTRIHIKSFNKHISLKELSFSYKKNQQILENINIKINKNETIGIVGNSGSGKTTLLDIFSGLENSFNGQILIDGKKINFKTERWKPNIGYVSQKTFIFEGSIKQNIISSNIFEDIDLNKLREALLDARLEKWVDSLPDGIDSNVGHEGYKISEGQKQRIGIARALYKNPEFFVFDEPTSSLDTETENEIMDTIYNLSGSKTILIVSHIKSTLVGCNRIIDLNES